MKIVCNDEDIRLDKYLADNTDYSREYILKMRGRPFPKSLKGYLR